MTQVVTNSKLIRCQCGSCNSFFKVNSRFNGRLVNCPNCQQKMKIVALASKANAASKAPPQRQSKKQANTSAKLPKDKLETYASLARPMQVAMVSLLTGPLATGGVLAWNHYKLGNKRSAIFCLLVSLLTFLVVVTSMIAVADATRGDAVLGQLAGLFLQAMQIAAFTLYASERWKTIWKLDGLPKPSFQTSGKMVLLIAAIGFILSVAGYFILLGFFHWQFV